MGIPPAGKGWSGGSIPKPIFTTTGHHIIARGLRLRSNLLLRREEWGARIGRRKSGQRMASALVGDCFGRAVPVIRPR